MNDLKFHPYRALPTCDVCGAVCTSLDTEREDNKLISAIVFACGSTWVASCRAQFDTSTFPNGKFEAYDRHLNTWTETSVCDNAVEVVRQQRKEKQE